MDGTVASAPETTEGPLSAKDAVGLLVSRHEAATGALRTALDRYLETGVPPSPEARAGFCYPELRLIYQPSGPPLRSARAYGRVERAGVYATTVTEPDFFRDYLLESLDPLVREYGVALSVGSSQQQIPYPYVIKGGDELAQRHVSASDLARHFPAPRLSECR